MDHGTFRAKLKGILNRSDCTDAQADIHIDGGYERCNRVLDHYLREATFTNTLATESATVTLPADTGKKLIEVRVDGIPTEGRPDRTAQTTSYLGYQRRGPRTLVFNQALPVGTVLEVVYWRDFARPTTDTGTNDLLDLAHLVLLYASLVEAGIHWRHDDRGVWAEAFTGYLAEALQENNDRDMAYYGGPMVIQTPAGAGADY